MAQQTDEHDRPDEGVVPFDTGCLGCLLVILVPAMGLFALAAFDTDVFAELADSPRPRNWLGALAPFRFGGVNIAVLLLTAMLSWEVFKLARRFVDVKAVWVDGEVVRFHPTLRRSPVALSSLQGVSHDADDLRSVLVFQQAGGPRIEVAMVDHEAARAFVAEVERARAALERSGEG